MGFLRTVFNLEESLRTKKLWLWHQGSLALVLALKATCLALYQGPLAFALALVSKIMALALKMLTSNPYLS